MSNVGNYGLIILTVGTLTPNQQAGLTSMTLHELFTLSIIPIGTSGTNQIQYMKYISEYILKLQIHQHSLLTRKVFSWHNSSAQVFFSRSSSKMDHHWIIIKFGSSVDHHHHRSTISINWCYLSILLVTGNSIEPALFHVGCRPSLHVGLHLL